MEHDEQPRRRADERNGGDRAVVSPEAARFYFRRALRNPADFPPAPGPAAPGLQVVPDPDAIAAKYEEILSLIGTTHPMRCARLKDLADRVRAAGHRYRQAFRDEEELLQNRNEEARRADSEIDRMLQDLRRRYEQEEQKHLQARDRVVEEWEKVREKIAALGAALGLEVSDGDAEGDSSEDDGARPLDGAAAAGDGASAPAREGSNGHGAPPGADGAHAVAPPSAPAGEPAPQPRSASAEAGAGTPPGPAEAPAQPDAARAPAGEAKAGASSPSGGDAPEKKDGPRFRYLTVEFPSEEAARQSASERALAARYGLIWPDELHDQTKWQRFALLAGKWLATVVFGAIFGFSVGILLDVLNPKVMQIDWTVSAGPLAACVLAGWSVFWAIGRGVTGIVLTIADYVYGAMMADVREDGSVSRVFHRKIRWCALGVGAAAIVATVAIEAIVERNGIVAVFAEAQENLRRVSGAATGQPHGPGEAQYWALSLIASVPFVVLYAVTAWREGKSHAIKTFLEDRRELEAHTRATELYRRRYEAAVMLAGGEMTLEAAEAPDETADLAEQDAEAGPEPAPERPPLAQTDGAEGAASAEEPPLSGSAQEPAPAREDAVPAPAVPHDAQPAQPAPAAVAGDANGAAAGPGADAFAEHLASDSPIIKALSTLPGACHQLVARAELARLIIRRRNLWLRLNKLRERRKALERERQERCAALNAARKEEVRELPEPSYQRLLAAYRQWEDATKLFDDEYQRITREIERVRKGGMVWRVRKALFGRPADGQGPNDGSGAGPEGSAKQDGAKPAQPPAGRPSDGRKRPAERTARAVVAGTARQR